MARKKKQKHHGEEEGGEAWLLPYSDLMTLLLAVFIVLFAVSKMDQTKAEDISNAFKGMLTGGEGIMSEKGNSIKPNIKGTIEGSIQQSGGTGGASEENSAVSQKELEEFLGKYEFENMQELQSAIDDALTQEEMSEAVTTNIDLRGLVISLSNAILFDSGSAEIKPQYEDSLMKIGELVRKSDNHIRIEGHTDNRPISTSVYPSNWELSTARASQVVRLFTTECNISPEKLVAVGYGEYKPIADNSTEEGRKKNRRIEIIILSEKYNNLEEQYPTGKINN